MSTNDNCEGFKLVWKIENFSCLEGKSQLSPSLFWHSSFWKAKISNQNNNISFELQSPFIPEECIFNCSFALLDSDGIPLIWRERKRVKPGISVYFSEFINKDWLSSRKTILLPNDTLTVQCCIWRTPRGLLTPVSRFALTRMELEAVVKKTFTWDVADVSSLKPLQFFERKEALRNDVCLTIKLTLNGDDEFEVMLRAITLTIIHMRINIAVLDASDEKIEFANRECVILASGQKWTFSTNVSKAMLMCHQSHFLSEDTLSLQFTCTFLESMYKVAFNSMVDESQILANIPRTTAAINPPKSLSQTLQDMYNEGFLSDFNLKVGDRVFPVHRALLGVRSQVFRAIFTTEMKEKQDNCVDIQDMDGDTLQRLLQFVYSDTFEKDLGWEDASSLYAAADKYDLEILKQGCSDILKSRLCVSSVLDVLSIADMHQDQDLKSAALDFISLNDIVGSEHWIRFEEKNGLLALETCRKLYVKKTNH